MISTLSAFSGFTPNSPLIYGLYGAVVAFVVAMSLYYIVRSVRRAKALNMDMGKIKKVFTTSAVFSILGHYLGAGLAIKNGSQLNPSPEAEYRFRADDHLVVIGKSADVFRMAGKA